MVREDQPYVREVVCGFRGPNRLAQRTHDAFVAAIRVPAGFRVEDWTGGRLEDDERARGLWLTLALGIALVLLSVAPGFDSAWAAAMVFLSLPLALAEVMAAFWATGTAFTREAAVGVILVVGLAVNQAILLVDTALDRRRANVRRGARAGLSAPPLLRAALDRSAMIVLVTASTLASLGAAGRAAGARAGPGRPGSRRVGRPGTGRRGLTDRLVQTNIRT